MSFDAVRWAMKQPVRPALTKFCLVAMAECVNSESQEVVCWPSYAYLCALTGMNTKTVEQAVFTLKQQGFITDTGRRAGGTGKVVVYLLNTTKSGGIPEHPTTPIANGTRPQNATETGGVISQSGLREIPPNTAPNPPKFDGQSPQITGETPPKTGDGIRKEQGKRTRKEPGIGAVAVPGVAAKLVADWLEVRRDKKAGTLTETAVEGLQREATKAGLTTEEAVRYCIEANWVGFNAGFYANREGKTGPQRARGQGQSAVDRTAEAARLLGITPPRNEEIIDA